MSRIFAAMLLVSAIPFVGCSTLNLNPLASNPSSTTPVVEENSVGDCQVSFRGESGSVESQKVALQPNSTVQQVLAKSNGLKKFSRMEIVLARPLPNGSWHKMDVDFDRTTRRVAAANDYNVQPGDRILVKQDTRTIFDDMVEKSPIGSAGKMLSSRMMK